MKNNANNSLAFNKSTLLELSDAKLMTVNGGTLQTSGYCCETTKQLELVNNNHR